MTFFFFFSDFESVIVTDIPETEKSWIWKILHIKNSMFQTFINSIGYQRTTLECIIYEKHIKAAD